MPSLPPELIDLILSLLVTQPKLLRRCIAASSILACLAERHLYKHINVTSSTSISDKPNGADIRLKQCELIVLLRKRPHLATYINSICAELGHEVSRPVVADLVSSAQRDVATVSVPSYPQLPSLRSLTLTTPRPVVMDWRKVSGEFRILWEALLSTLSVEEVTIRGVWGIPMTMLEISRNLKRLHLFDLTIDSSQHSSVLSTRIVSSLSNLQHLSFSSNARPCLNVLSWLAEEPFGNPKASQLRSLDFRPRSSDEFAHLIRILNVSSKSLESLTLDIGGPCSFSVFSTSHAGPQFAANTEISNTVGSGLRIPFSSLPKLNKLIIHTAVMSRSNYVHLNANSRRYVAALPVIGGVLRDARTRITGPPIDIIIDTKISRTGSLFPTIADIDFSPLAAGLGASASNSSPGVNRSPVILIFREGKAGTIVRPPFVTEVQDNEVLTGLIKDGKVMLG